jgi:8-oxo-dGTP diphosphatase
VTAPAEGPRIHVVAAVIQREGRYLVGRRPLHKHHGGLWEFPGGKLAPGETAHAAVTRELREELDLTVDHSGPSLHVERDGALFIEFLAATVTGEPKRLEHSALAWHTPTELAALPLAPADARFVALLAGASHD